MSAPMMRPAGESERALPRRFRFNHTNLTALPAPPAGKQAVVHDEVCPGLIILVTPAGKKTFYLYKKVNGVPRRIWLGGFPDKSVEQARKAARKEDGQVALGIDPILKRRAEQRQRADDAVKAEWQGYTLRQAREDHILNMRAKGCSDRSITDIMDSLDLHLKDWLDAPLAAITRADAIDRHRRMSKKRGPVVANDVIRRFRAIYNTARRRYQDLPECPTVAIAFNKQYRKREPVEDLAAWWSLVQTIPNVIRRDFQLFVLLTGLRAGDACRIKLDEVNWSEGTLHRPCPKGGESKAFTVPLSGLALEILKRRRDGNPDRYGQQTPWAFPCRNRDGVITHVAEPKEQRFVKGEDGKVRKVKFLPSPHRLRDSFVTIALTEANVDPITAKCLVNHALPGGDVTVGYVRPSIPVMREATEKITAVIRQRAGIKNLRAYLPRKLRRQPHRESL